MLNAGRGNPNWVATAPREGFFLFGQFALTECRRTMDDPKAGLAGMPQMRGIADRLEAWLTKHSDMPGADFLSNMVEHGVKAFGFDADAFVWELAELDHRRQLSGAGSNAGPQRANRSSIPDVGDVR